MHASRSCAWNKPVVALLACVASAQAFALEPFEGMQVHGFLSQGLVHTSDNRFFGDSDDGASSEFTELGINASWRAQPGLLLSAQGVSRRAGEGDHGEIRLDYGFAHVSGTLGAAPDWGLQIGKSKLPYGLYNETRDVAHTRPGILLPQSIYFDRARNLALAATGVQGMIDFPLSGGRLRLRAGAGLPEVDDPSIEYAFIGIDLPGHFESRATEFAQVMYIPDSQQMRFALTHVVLDMPYSLGGLVEFRPWILSASYDGEDFSLTSEVMLNTLRSTLALPAIDQHGLSYYLQCVYRASSRWEWLLRHDVFYADRNDRDGSEFALAHPGFPAVTGYARDWTLGLRHHLTSDMMLAAEWHRVDGAGWLPLEDNQGTGLTRRWDMLLLQASYRF